MDELLADLRNAEVTRVRFSFGPSPAQWEEIAEAMERSTSARSCTIHRMTLTDAGAASLVAAIARSPGIIELNILLTRITDSCAAVLAEAVVKKLHKLACANCQLTEIGVAAIAAAVGRSPTITSLMIAGNMTTYIGVVAVADAVRKSTSLAYLDLTHDAIGDRGAFSLAEAIERSPSILAVSFFGSNCSSKGMSAVHSAVLRSIHIRKLLAFLAAGFGNQPTPASSFLKRDGDHAIAWRVLQSM